MANGEHQAKNTNESAANDVKQQATKKRVGEKANVKKQAGATKWLPRMMMSVASIKRRASR